MLGKASEIKVTHISADYIRFQDHIDSWKNSFLDVEIIDIKFSAVSDPGNEERVHALIIYKEAKQ
ncbi:hypothetical protein ACFQ3W_24865 [Paenibacillus puldeungensis]|uniref:Sporulation protein Cse60 n=1 Tax=Paenibacillus puldeungensis TaxID=696536 RepID=A0ABW3S4T3_9BACL